MSETLDRLIREALELEPAERLDLVEAVLRTVDGSETTDPWEDPIVAEVHRIREELLAEFDGDVAALMEDANRRLLAGEFGDRPIVTYPPKRPHGWSDTPLSSKPE